MTISKSTARLQVVLQLRKHQRDVCRQALAAALREDGRLLAERARLEVEQAEQLQQLHVLSGAGRVDVDGASRRRYHAGQLRGDVFRVDLQRQQLAVRVAACRQALLAADQKVQALEKLFERRAAETRADELQSEQREREELWQAGQSRKGTTP